MRLLLSTNTNVPERHEQTLTYWCNPLQRTRYRRWPVAVLLVERRQHAPDHDGASRPPRVRLSCHHVTMLMRSDSRAVHLDRPSPLPGYRRPLWVSPRDALARKGPPLTRRPYSYDFPWSLQNWFPLWAGAEHHDYVSFTAKQHPPLVQTLTWSSCICAAPREVHRLLLVQSPHLYVLAQSRSGASLRLTSFKFHRGLGFRHGQAIPRVPCATEGAEGGARSPEVVIDP